MISENLLDIYDSVEDMFAAIDERGIQIQEHKMNLIPSLVASIKGIAYPDEIDTDNLTTVSAKTTAILQIKAQIKTVITNSGVSVGDDLTTYGDCIRAILQELRIVGPTEISGETCSLKCTLGNMIVSPAWSVLGGSEYCSIDSSGLLTINSGASSTQVTIKAVYNDLTAVLVATLTYVQNSNTEVTVTIDENTGNISTATTTTTENGDGSTTTTTSTTVNDASGNVVGSSTNETTQNSDGSSTSSTVNYDADGDKTGEVNENTDTDGNVSTQTITTDSDGNDIVTAYTVDTSANPDGEKVYNGDGEDTEFIPFDGTNGLVLHIRFKGSIADQPNPPIVNDPTDSSRLYTIVNLMEEAKPWPGIVLRFSSRSSNLVTTIVYYNTSGRSTTKTQEIRKTADDIYDLTITYDPSLSSNNISIFDNINSTTVWSVTGTIGTHNISTTIGYSYYPAGGYNYRYSKMDLYEFSIEKIT